MELHPTFSDYKCLIETIRLFIIPNFLIDELETFKFLYMCPIYDRDDLFDDDIISFKNDYNEGNMLNKIIDYTYNFIDSTLRDNKNNETLQLNREWYSASLINFKYLNDTNLLRNAFENIISPQYDNMYKIVEIVAGRKVYPLDMNKVLEYSSWEFISKYYNKLFRKHTFQKEISMKTIVINNTFNNVKCTIPRNLFETYCKFNDLITDYSYVREFVIPVEFNETACRLFVKSLEDSKITINDNVLERDFIEFKNMVSYLQVNVINRDELR